MRHLLTAALAATLLLSACGESEDEGPDMMPGSDCLSCHSGGGEAPRFTAAGTVFSGGSSTAGVGGAQVTLQPASGAAVVVTTRASGNFYTSSPLTFPVTVTVTAGGQTNQMGAGATSGACNHCHAPGGVSARVHVGNCSACHA